MYNEKLAELAGITGFVGACVVDCGKALPLAAHGKTGPDLGRLAQDLAALRRAEGEAQEMVGTEDRAEAFEMTVGNQVHLTKVLDDEEETVLYLILNRRTADMRDARDTLRTFEELPQAA